MMYIVQQNDSNETAVCFIDPFFFDKNAGPIADKVIIIFANRYIM